MKVKLVLMRGSERVKEIPINTPVAIIGRGAGSDIRIVSHEISRHHCRLKVKDDVVTVKDLGSANGTSINGQQILERGVLRHGDYLQLGGITLRVEFEALKAIAVAEDDVPEGAAVAEGVVVLEEEPAPLEVEAVSVEDAVAVDVPALDAEEDLPMAEVEEDEEDLPMAEVEDLPMADVEDEEEETEEGGQDVEPQEADYELVEDAEANGQPVEGVEENATEDKKLISLVLWLSEPRYLDSVILQRQVSQAFGVDRDELGDDDDETDFVVGEAPAFVIQFRGFHFAVFNVDSPYVDDPEAEAQKIMDVRLRKALLEHKSWLAVDLLGDVEPERLPEVYRYLGKLIATLADTDCLAIYSPATEQINIYDAELEQKLRGDNPLEAFEVLTKVPVVEVSEDDPRMRAAVEEARRRWPEFAAAFQRRRPDQHFAVKVPFEEGDSREFMWVTVQQINGDVIEGVLDSDPVDIKKVAAGDQVRVKLEDLNDWGYTEGDEMIGGFTVKLLTELQEGES